MSETPNNKNIDINQEIYDLLVAEINKARREEIEEIFALIKQDNVLSLPSSLHEPSGANSLRPDLKEWLETNEISYSAKIYDQTVLLIFEEVKDLVLFKITWF